MSLARDLAFRALDRIVDRYSPTEIGREDDGTFLALTSPALDGQRVGELRMWHGGPVHKLVYIGLVVEQMNLDSHMVFAFTAPDSPVPHFTIDSVKAPMGPPGPDTPVGHAFHLDLIQRLDLATDMGYVDAAYTPLTDAYEAARHIEGLSEAHLTRRQWAVMSPWMLASRATPEAFAAITDTADAYLDHWMGLCDAGLEVDTSVDLAARDRAHRRILFDPDVDPVWHQVARIVGDDTSEQLRDSLVAQDVPAAV